MTILKKNLKEELEISKGIEDTFIKQLACKPIEMYSFSFKSNCIGIPKENLSMRKFTYDKTMSAS